MELETFGAGSRDAALKRSSPAPDFLSAAPALENTDCGDGGGGGAATDVCRKRCRWEHGHARTVVAPSACSVDRCQDGTCLCKRARTQTIPRPPTPPRFHAGLQMAWPGAFTSCRKRNFHHRATYVDAGRQQTHTAPCAAHKDAHCPPTHTCVTQTHTPSEASCGGDGGGGGGHLSDGVTIATPTATPGNGATTDSALPPTTTSTRTAIHPHTHTHTDPHTTASTHAHTHTPDTHTASLHIDTCTPCQPPHMPTVDAHTRTHTTDTTAPPTHTLQPHTPTDTPARTPTHTHTDAHTHTDDAHATVLHHIRRRKSVTFAVPLTIIADEPPGPYSPFALASIAFNAELYDMDEISSNFASKLCHR